TEVTAGVSYDGRNYEELTEALGPFAKYLPVRLRADAGLTFADALRQVDEAARAAEQRQESFDWQLDDTDADGSDADAPFFPCCFDFSGRAPEVSAAGVAFDVTERHACVDRFKLKLSVEDLEGRAGAALHYDAERFDADAVARLAAQFEQLLRSAVAAPGEAVARLELLPAAERERVLFGFNRTRTEKPADEFCHRLFEAQAARTPDAVAVVHKETQLTYGELNARANRVAHRLRRLGVGPDVPVAVLAERSVELLAGLLGVLKAGGAYVPLDLQYPQARLAYMLASAAPAVLLTQEKFKELLPGASSTRVLSLDGERESLLAESAENPRGRVTGDNLAYVLFTSGSTGQPKGVMIPHRGLANYLDWCLRTYVAPGGAGAPVHSPVGFDLTVTGLFAPLAAGQRVVLLEEGAGGAGLAAALRGSAERFSFVKLTPAHLDLLGHELTPEELAGRADALVVGGEMLTYESLAAWRRHAPATRLINEYGPTETVVGCCTYEMREADECAGAIPIGRPIINTQIYLLDKSWQPVPYGAVGELYVGGDGVARGYH
ncbi:MAG TPA: AMP-binding protein, partial [Pyrinomonadaceae bacterium]